MQLLCTKVGVVWGVASGVHLYQGVVWGVAWGKGVAWGWAGVCTDIFL